MKNFVVFAMLVGFLLGSSVHHPQDQGESLRELSARAGSQDTAEAKEAHVRKIVLRLDSLIKPIFREHRTPAEIQTRIEAAFEKDTQGPMNRDILFQQIAGSEKFLIAYNIPLTPSWSQRLVVLRIWSPPAQMGGEGVLAPLVDSSSDFSLVESFPVIAIDDLQRDGGRYVILHGHIGHGHGRDALSLWSIDERRCIWVRAFDYGDRLCFVVNPLYS